MTVSGLVSKATRGRLRPAVGWVATLGGGTLAGMGFTVSLLVVSVVFTGIELQEATLGVLTAAVLAALLTWLVFQIAGRLPPQTRARALLGQSPAIVDLADLVDADRDHIRGPADAHVTLVEYGDFECPFCGQAEPVVRELPADFGTCATCGATCRLTTCIRGLSWRPRHQRRPGRRGASGRCTIC